MKPRVVKIAWKLKQSVLGDTCLSTQIYLCLSLCVCVCVFARCAPPHTVLLGKKQVVVLVTSLTAVASDLSIFVQSAPQLLLTGRVLLYHVEAHCVCSDYSVKLDCWRAMQIYGGICQGTKLSW